MKKINLFLIAACLTATTAIGQNAKFMDAMKKTIAEFNADSTAEQFMTVANKFERIALAEKSEWLPYYYASLSKTYVSFLTEDKSKVDEILDDAQKLADKADSIAPNNSEIVLLKSMILGGRIMVDPMNRGMQYGMQAGTLTNQSIQLNPENPRAYLMMGQSLFYTPEQFGGGKDKACVMLQTSKEKYETFTPATEIDPNWGKDMMLQLIAQCTSDN